MWTFVVLDRTSTMLRRCESIAEVRTEDVVNMQLRIVKIGLLNFRYFSPIRIQIHWEPKMYAKRDSPTRLFFIFHQRLTLVPMNKPQSDFEFLRNFVELFVLKNRLLAIIDMGR